MKKISQEKIEKLKAYFNNKSEVLMAFVFGSRAKGIERETSDWDIAAYFKPRQYGELETKYEYSEERNIWMEIEKILKSNEVDFLVLNRARPSLVFNVLNAGLPLVIKDRKLYLKLLIKTHYEALDFRQFVNDYFAIAQRSKSLTDDDKTTLKEHLIFLENEFNYIEKFKQITYEEYLKDDDKRRNIERWIENLIMAVIDMSKIILASGKKNIPPTYKETLLHFAIEFMDEEQARKFAQFAELRNIAVHEYLDIKWEKIKNFVKEAENSFPNFIKKTKEIIQ